MACPGTTYLTAHWFLSADVEGTSHCFHCMLSFVGVRVSGKIIFYFLKVFPEAGQDQDAQLLLNLAPRQ